MPHTARLGLAMRHAMGERVGELASGGLLVIYTGERPDDLDGDRAGPALFRFVVPSVRMADDGSLILDGPIEAEALFRGRATWVCVFDRSGSPLWDGSVGTKRSDNLVVNAVDFERGDILRLSKMVLAFPDQ